MPDDLEPDDDLDHHDLLDEAMTAITPTVPLTRAEVLAILGPDPSVGER